MSMGRYFIPFKNDCYLMDEEFFCVEQNQQKIKASSDGL